MTLSNILFIGMDVHKKSIVISLANDDRKSSWLTPLILLCISFPYALAEVGESFGVSYVTVSRALKCLEGGA